MKIAVLGGGNGSYAAVADMMLSGHEVYFWRQNFAEFGSLIKGVSLKLLDYKGIHEIVPTKICRDIGDAVKGAELIICPLPAFAQRDIAVLLASHMKDGQVILLAPGTFGSFFMMQVMQNNGLKADIAIAETGTLPWLARRRPDENGKQVVAITTRASRLPTGVFPSRHTEIAVKKISNAFRNCIEEVEDALSAALMNAGPIIHSPLILMNAGPIDHFDCWNIHNEGTQSSIRRVHDRLDEERISVRKLLGYRPPHFPLADHYNNSNWMYGNLAHDKLIDSGDWHEKLNLTTHRYMAEDIGYGLTFLTTLGEWLGISLPVASGLLAIGEAASDQDFRKIGRTWGSLGLSGISVLELNKILKDGI